MHTSSPVMPAAVPSGATGFAGATVPTGATGFAGATVPTGATGFAGATVWFTGLPSAGKTTLATEFAARLRQLGRPVELLDGDVVRPVLSPELGYSRPDRDANVTRIGWVASVLARHGVLALAAVVSPFSAARDAVRARHDEAGVAFLEIHVATAVDVCASRDVKGLYARQRDGAMAGLTGVDAEYEPPRTPSLRVDTAGRTVTEIVDELVALLEKENLL